MTFTFSWNQIKLVLIVLFIACSFSLSGGYYLCWTKYRDVETIQEISKGFIEFRTACSDSFRIIRNNQLFYNGKVDNLQIKTMQHLYPKAYNRKLIKKP